MDTIKKNFFLEMIAHARNAKRENLLHYACGRNEYRVVEILIDKGYGLCQQDYLGRSPMHVALDAGHRECLEVLRKLLHNYSANHPRLQRDLCALLNVYNNKGYTIVHEAVLRDMKSLVHDLLAFCKERNLNLANYEVLGCGDSVLHLAARCNLLEMAEMICQACPNLVKCPNYGGLLPEKMHDITEEMRTILKRRTLSER